MANLLQQYGIKEVADVTLYDTETGAPVLFLDTLKVSTIEQTADQAEARGGKGNSPLIIWDFGKEITVTLEDALYSPASMAIMFGEGQKAGAVASISQITRMEKKVFKDAAPTALPTGSTKWYMLSSEGLGMVPLTTLSAIPTMSKGDKFVVYEETVVEAEDNSGVVININADSFPGTYKLVGETYARNRDTGKDEFFQFIIPQAKMSAENTITLEAEGDPSVFNMTMRVLRPEDGAMMKLLQYKYSKSNTATQAAQGGQAVVNKSGLS